MGIELEGARVCHLMDPTRVGTIVGRARCHGAYVVRWDHSGGCSVVPWMLCLPTDLAGGASSAILRNAAHRDLIRAWRESGKRGPA